MPPVPPAGDEVTCWLPAAQLGGDGAIRDSLNNRGAHSFEGSPHVGKAHIQSMRTQCRGLAVQPGWLSPA